MSKTYDWCNSKVEYISKTYIDMENTIKKVPASERELVEIQDFIKVSREKTKNDLELLQLQITKHMNMLDNYGHRVQD